MKRKKLKKYEPMKINVSIVNLENSIAAGSTGTVTFGGNSSTNPLFPDVEDWSENDQNSSNGPQIL